MQNVRHVQWEIQAWNQHQHLQYKNKCFKKLISDLARQRDPELSQGSRSSLDFKALSLDTACDKAKKLYQEVPYRTSSLSRRAAYSIESAWSKWKAYSQGTIDKKTALKPESNSIIGTLSTLLIFYHWDRFDPREHFGHLKQLVLTKQLDPQQIIWGNLITRSSVHKKKFDWMI